MANCLVAVRKGKNKGKELVSGERIERRQVRLSVIQRERSILRLARIQLSAFVCEISPTGPIPSLLRVSFLHPIDLHEGFQYSKLFFRLSVLVLMLEPFHYEKFVK